MFSRLLRENDELVPWLLPPIVPVTSPLSPVPMVPNCCVVTDPIVFVAPVLKMLKP